MSNDQICQYNSESLEHLGLISATLDKTKIISKIDHRLPVSKIHGSKISMGERFAALIYNAMGFIDSRLYLFPEFLSGKPIKKLFGRDIDPKCFNDDSMGRLLDAISEYGVNKLFTELSMEIGMENNLLGKSIHCDTTSLTLSGEYKDDS